MLPPRMWPILSSRQFLAPSEASLHIVIVAAWDWEVVVPSRLCSHWGALLSAGWRFFMALSLGGQCAHDLHSSWGLRHALCPAVPSPLLFPALQRPCLGLHRPCPSYHSRLGSCLLTLSLPLAPRARLAIQDLLAVACLCFLLLLPLHLPPTQEDVSQGTRV